MDTPHKKLRVGSDPHPSGFRTPEAHYVASNVTIQELGELWKDWQGCTKTKLKTRCDAEGWNALRKQSRRVASSRIVEAAQEAAAGDVEQRIARHLGIAREAQYLGLEAIRQLRELVKDGFPIRPQDAIKAAIEGVRLERLVLGESTENIAAVVVQVREEITRALTRAGVTQAIPVVEMALAGIASRAGAPGSKAEGEVVAAATEVEFSFKALERDADGQVRVKQYSARLADPGTVVPPTPAPEQTTPSRLPGEA